jgi:hypothetical protein
VKYRWKTHTQDEFYRLCLLIDGDTYEVATVEKNRYTNEPDWTAFVTGFVSEEKTPVEGVSWEYLIDAKAAVLNYIKVWWVSGAFQRMDDKERSQWRQFST